MTKPNVGLYAKEISKNSLSENSLLSSDIWANISEVKPHFSLIRSKFSPVKRIFITLFFSVFVSNWDTYWFAVMRSIQWNLLYHFTWLLKKIARGTWKAFRKLLILREKTLPWNVIRGARLEQKWLSWREEGLQPRSSPPKHRSVCLAKSDKEE